MQVNVTEQHTMTSDIDGSIKKTTQHTHSSGSISCHVGPDDPNSHSNSLFCDSKICLVYLFDIIIMMKGQIIKEL